ncbi:MAG: hypothetical protein IPK79_03605 [Vampirovibrionales bacterium]|nr:hypothetical protein [Vampirovibrionales bacterium]
MGTERIITPQGGAIKSYVFLSGRNGALQEEGGPPSDVRAIQITAPVHLSSEAKTERLALQAAIQSQAREEILQKLKEAHPNGPEITLESIKPPIGPSDAIAFPAIYTVEIKNPGGSSTPIRLCDQWQEESRNASPATRWDPNTNAHQKDLASVQYRHADTESSLTLRAPELGQLDITRDAAYCASKPTSSPTAGDRR